MLSFFFLNLMLPWQPNKMAPGHQTHKLSRQSSNDHNCQIWFTSLQLLCIKCNLTIVPLFVYGSFLLPWQLNQETDHPNFSYFELSLAKQHLNQIRIILLQWFWSCHLIIPFLKFNVAMASKQNGRWSSNT